MSHYKITPLPIIRPDETEWLVSGGQEPYTVRRNARGEFRCTCPVMTKSNAGQRAMAQRNGCKHCNVVRCFLGDHKFMPSLTADGGQECVRCFVSIAEFEFKEYGPPDPSEAEAYYAGGRM